MNYKIYIYIICLFASVFAVAGINFESLIRKNKIFEARLLGLLISFSLAYLTANFIIDFIEYSKFL